MIHIPHVRRWESAEDQEDVGLKGTRWDACCFLNRARERKWSTFSMFVHNSVLLKMVDLYVSHRIRNATYYIRKNFGSVSCLIIQSKLEPICTCQCRRSFEFIFNVDLNAKSSSLADSR